MPQRLATTLIQRVKMSQTIRVIGAGLAGSEACYQLLKRGYHVDLYECKNRLKNPVQVRDDFAELVCSNSLKSNEITNACGLLKEELRMLDSLLIKVADECRVPSGGALAVDRDIFASTVTARLLEFPNLTIHKEEFTEIDPSIPTIIATGPLTSASLCKSIEKLFSSGTLYFFDAVAPIIDADSLDQGKCFVADRYGKGTGDYINCPLERDEYLAFYDALIHAKTVKLHDFEGEVFEGCMPVETLAKRGVDSLRYGPMKPKGIWHPVTGQKYYAVVQLRKESNTNNLYNIVGFQTNLTFPEQKRVFSMIPALKNAEFLRYGVMHKNNYINAPKVINEYYQCRDYPNLFIAGQLSGVEGYVESISSGLLAALNIVAYTRGLPMVDLSDVTMIGALAHFISSAEAENFQPMNSNWGIVPSMENTPRDKKEKNKMLAERAINTLKLLSKEKYYDIINFK